MPVLGVIILFTIILGIFAASILAGTFGAMLGLGGGIIVIPVLTVIFRVPMKEAVATSLVTVVATSTSAAVVYVDKHIANVRLGMVLEMATTIGALTGAFLARSLTDAMLRLLFAALLTYTAVTMSRKAGSESSTTGENYICMPGNATQADIDEQIRQGNSPYAISKYPAGMSASFGAGMISAMLGVGGGIIKVPVMRLVMGVPMRVAVATSNFMIGVTAATSALVFYAGGLINPTVTAPAALGVLVGAQFGTRLVRKLNTKLLTRLFIAMMVITAVEMIKKALF